MRTRKPTDVQFPVPRLGFQTDTFCDTLIASIVPVREIPPKPKRHRWSMIGMREWACIDCAQTRRKPGGDTYRYFNRDGKYVGHHAPECDGVPA